MPLRNWKCKKCGTTEVFWDHEEPVCKCGGRDMKKLLSRPLQARSCDKVDKYHNTDMERGIEEDLRARNRRHTLDTIDEFIEKHGERAAKEVGLLITEDNGRTWRKKTIWDDKKTLGKANKGSAPKRVKK